MKKRLGVDPVTFDHDYSPAEIEFMMAMESYKREYRRPFPTWSEVLEVLRSLGYRQVEAPSQITERRLEIDPGLAERAPRAVQCKATRRFARQDYDDGSVAKQLGAM